MKDRVRAWLGVDYVAPPPPETQAPPPVTADCGHVTASYATYRDGTTRCLPCHER